MDRIGDDSEKSCALTAVGNRRRVVINLRREMTMKAMIKDDRRCHATTDCKILKDVRLKVLS